MIISLLVILFFLSVGTAGNPAYCQSTLKAEAAKNALLSNVQKTNSPDLLHGNVSESKLRALTQYASFGFLCTRESAGELPARVNDVILHSMAYWQGLKAGDRIMQVHIAKNTIELAIERDGKPYSVTLTDQHPITVLEIAKSGLNGIVQKNYGDCWFDAAIGAIASTPTGQNLISAMIRQASPTSYYVTFWDQPNISWPISFDTIKNYQLQDKSLWASLLEQACLIRFRNEHRGGQIEVAMKVLTGKDPQVAVPNGVWDAVPGPRVSLLQMADIITKALANHEPVELSTRSEMQLRMEIIGAAYKKAGVSFDSQGRVNDPNLKENYRAHKYDDLIAGSRTVYVPLILWGNHAYTVTAFDPNTNMITLRNPFGTDEQPLHGADWAGRVDIDERKRLVQDLGQGYIKLKLDDLYRYINKLVWVDL